MESFKSLELTEMGQLAELTDFLAYMFKVPCGDPVTVKEAIMSGGYAVAITLDGVIVGGAWAMPGYDERGVYLRGVWGAVDDKHSGSGLGTAINEFQCQVTANRGVSRLRWTFDPLIPVRAHMFVNKYKAVLEGYEENCFGEISGVLGPQNGEVAPSDRVHATRYTMEEPQLNETGEVVTVTLPKSDSYTSEQAVEEMRSTLKPQLNSGLRVARVSASEDEIKYHLATVN